MAKIRVLIVDDSVVVRRLVSEELARDPALEVVGTAANGRIGLAKIPQVNPDLVILDIEMPEMDGLTALAELRKTYPRLPVIMFSALTERGAMATLDALSLGATDYFTKPSASGGMAASQEVIRTELIPEIKALFAPRLVPAVAPAPTTVAPTRRPGRVGPIKLLAIGTSTGGPNALADLFAQLPARMAVPIVVVQHMPPMFTRMLAERLTRTGAIPVEEGQTGKLLQPGQAMIAPGDHHLTVVRNDQQVRVLLNQDPPENSCRPSVDVMFRSAVQAFGSGVLGVILTGMGQDGLRGCEAIHEAGGEVLAQDEPSSVVWGMPGYVVRAGLADKVLPLSAMAGEIVRRVSR